MLRLFVCFYILLLHSSFERSLYETSNLDRGGNNRKKKIEEFSKSSREKLVQSKNKMFSKFTSILQHAVEAVSSTPRAQMIFVEAEWRRSAFGRQLAC